MTHLILIRHGQSIANLQRRFAGHTDVDLTDTGRMQAQRAGAYLHKHYAIDAIFASDLCRAYHTALPTAHRFGLPVQTDEGLREIFAGEWEMRTYEELMRDYTADFSTWRFDCSNARCTGGESVAELYDRFCACVLRIAAAHEGKTVLIAAHSTPVRAFTALAAGYDRMHVAEVASVANASINRFSVENGVVRALELNITEHLNVITEDPKE